MMTDESMIGRLLQVLYPREHHMEPRGINVGIDVKQGLVKLSDSKACDGCQKRRPERIHCDRINLKINTSNSPVGIVDFEKYITQFDHTPAEVRDRCDYLLFDATVGHSKIAFCDLTCSEEKYVNPNTGSYPAGKRAKAVKQMQTSLECLLEEPFSANYILTFPSKVCLFGWREYNVPDATPMRGDAARNMLAFMNTPSSKSGKLTKKVTIVGHDFTFVQVKYPTVYQW